MENTDIKRLEKVKFFLEFRSYSEFSRAIGLKNAQIFTDIRLKKSSITKNLARKICDYAPSISFEWLLSGEGDMVIDNHPSAPSINTISQKGDNVQNNGMNDENISKMIDTIHSQQQTIQSLVEMLKSSNI